MSLARNWRLIGVLLVAGLIFWGLTLWDGPFGFGKSRDALALEREMADAEARHQATLRELDARIADIQREAALNRQRIALLSERGHDEIEATRPDGETMLDAQSVRAWRGAIERLRDNAGADPASADPGGGGVTG